MPFVAASGVCYEQLPLKRSRLQLGRPDVYPQTPNQQEDDFYSHVKCGFPNPPLDDEHKPANKELILTLQEKTVKILADIKLERERLNTVQESSKKKFTLSIKDNFWPFSSHNNKAKRHLVNWMGGLASGERDLATLGRKIPIFNKKDDILVYLWEYQVPMSRAAWVIKLAAYYTTTQQDSVKKSKARGAGSGSGGGGTPSLDNSSDWTAILTKALQELLENMKTKSESDLQEHRSKWSYYNRLARHMFEEGLLDKYEFICWILDAIESDRFRDPYDPFDKIFVPLVYGYLDEVTLCEPLSRRLATFCCRRLAMMFDNIIQSNPHIPHSQVFVDYMSCERHRPMVMSMICAVQIIALCCPSALIWLGPPPPDDPTEDEEDEQPSIGGDVSHLDNYNYGSPLDELPLPPSELPLPQSLAESASEFRSQLSAAEQLIRMRSRAVEQCWSSSKYQQSSTGTEIQRVLKVIEVLDKYNFDKWDGSNNVDTLYDSVFTNPPVFAESGTSVGPASPSDDWLIISLMCNWATTSQRAGAYRALVVACVLAKHQKRILSDAEDSRNTGTSFPLQTHLTRFLDECAPVLKGSESSVEEASSFSAVVHLMHELMEQEVISHDLYMRHLISRGLLTTGSGGGGGAMTDPEAVFTNRHLLFTLHFPVSSESVHELNQRSMLLYGFGGNRDKGSLEQTSMTEDLISLLKVQKDDSNVKDTVYDNMFSGFLELPFHDRQIVISNCCDFIGQKLDQLAEGSSTFQPHVKNIHFILQLAEASVCVSLILDIAENILCVISAIKRLVPSAYYSELLLCAVCHVRMFMQCMLLNDEQTSNMLEAVESAVSVVESASSCCSAERTLLHLLQHMVDCSSRVESAVGDKYKPIIAQLAPDTSGLNSASGSANGAEDTAYARSFLDKAGSLDCGNLAELVDRLRSKESFRSTFICAALLKICDTNQPNKLKKVNELALLCVEVTSLVPVMRCDWSAAVKGICTQQSQSKHYDTLVKRIKIEEASVYDNLAVFICYMTTRHLFNIQEVCLWIIHSVLGLLKDTSEREIACARMTMYILLKFLHASQKPHSLRLQVYSAIESHADRLLLQATYRALNVGPLLAILKAIATQAPCCQAGEEDSALMSQLSSAWDEEHTLQFMADADLSSVAGAVLHALASCRWVSFTCLRDPNQLRHDQILLDPVAGERMAFFILQLLCYPDRSTAGRAASFSDKDTPDDQEQEVKIRRIFDNLNRWNLRSSWLQFIIILENCKWNSTYNLFSLLARLTIELFDVQPSDGRSASGGLSSSRRTKTSHASGEQATRPPQRDPEVAWLVAPLISELPPSVQAAVLKQASAMLDRGGMQTSRRAGGDKERSVQKSIQLLSHGPFLSLVLTCLKGQDDQRESILSSLHSQFSQVINSAQKDAAATSNLSAASSEDGFSSSSSSSRMRVYSEELQLRLSLLGSMFQSIQANPQWTSEWAINLVNLLSSDIITPMENSQLLYTVVDMLVVLMETTDGRQDDASRKLHASLVKKIRKEIGDRDTEGLRLVRQLLPLPRHTTDIVTCEPVGTLYDSKGNKLTDTQSTALKQQGMQVCGKQKLSPWDLIEGFRNVLPLSMSWFGAVRSDKRGSVYEEQARAMFYHDHSALSKGDGYFLKSCVPVSDDDDVQHVSAAASVPTPNSAQSNDSGVPSNKRSNARDRSSSKSSGGTKRPAKRKSSRSQQPQQPQIGSQTPNPYTYAQPMNPTAGQFMPMGQQQQMMAGTQGPPPNLGPAAYYQAQPNMQQVPNPQIPGMIGGGMAGSAQGPQNSTKQQLTTHLKKRQNPAGVATAAGVPGGRVMPQRMPGTQTPANLSMYQQG